MLVGRKNCRKIVQFLVEPLMKKQSISQQVSGFFVSNSVRKIKQRGFNGLRSKMKSYKKLYLSEYGRQRTL